MHLIDCSLNEQSVKCIFDLNLSYVLTFVQLMFEIDVRSEVKELREQTYKKYN